MRRWLQLTLLLGLACRTDRVVRPACTEPGAIVTTVDVDKQVGRFQVDEEGCRFFEVSKEAGVRRIAMLGRYDGVWQTDFESFESRDTFIEHTAPRRDGGWGERTVTMHGDAGWVWKESETFDEGGRPAFRVRHTRLDALSMRVDEERRGPDGGWEIYDPFETSINQR